jgi:hypothetical protein
MEAGIGAVADVLQSRVLAGALFRDDLLRDAAIRGAIDWLQAEPGFDATWDVPPVARSILVLADPRYPSRLLDLADPPLLIYCVGDPGWLRGLRSASWAAGMRPHSARARRWSWPPLSSRRGGRSPAGWRRE